MSAVLFGAPENFVGVIVEDTVIQKLVPAVSRVLNVRLIDQISLAVARGTVAVM